MATSIAIMSVLLVAIASAIVLASHAIPTGDSAAERLLEARPAADRLLAELRQAIHFTERNETAVAFTVADRDGDGSPERIRYAWSAAAGDALTRQYNDREPRPLLESVDRFTLRFTTTSSSETYPGPPVTSEEQVLASHTNLLDTDLLDLEDRESGAGQLIRPDLPDDALRWRITRFQFSARQSGSADLRVAVHRAPGNLPEDPALQAETVSGDLISLLLQTYEVQFSNPRDLRPDQAVAVLLTRPDSNSGSIDVKYDRGGGGGHLRRTSSGTGSTMWRRYYDEALRHKAYGRYTSPGPDQTFQRRFIESVQVRLNTGGPQPAVDSGVELPNRPRTLKRLSRTRFEIAPTELDYNGDGESDWDTTDGTAFDTTSISNGTWTTREMIRSRAPHRFRTPTEARLRMRARTAGGDGAVCRINADWSGGETAPLIARCRLESDGTQTLELVNQTGSGNFRTLDRLAGLSDGFVELRMLIDPAADTVHLIVNGRRRGTYSYSRFTPVDAERTVVLGGSDAEAAFDRAAFYEAEPQ